MRVKNKTTSDSWFFRYREECNGRVVRRNIKVGSVEQLPTRKDAEKAVLALRANINSEVRAPQTVADLIIHYRKHELTADKKSHATIENFEGNLRRYILPKWGECRVSAVRTVTVEEWLNTLRLAPATRTKIRNQMSAIFSHGIRYEWFLNNPIRMVRTSSTRLRDPEILTPDEFRSLLPELSLRERAMVMLAGSTGLRRSELFALQWKDISLSTLEVKVTKAIVRNRMGPGKSPASRKPVPLHPAVADTLVEWRDQSPFRADSDYLFPSLVKNGKQPLFPDMVLQDYIRPALAKAGVARRIGWHSFRHSLATNLRSQGVDVKVTQDLMRHATSRTTLDFYTQSVSSDKRAASVMMFDLLMGGSNGPSNGLRVVKAAA